MKLKSRTVDCRRCLIMGSLAAARCSTATIESICERMRLFVARPRQIVFMEGLPALHLFAIRKGWVKLLKIDGTGREHVTAILESGDLFGLETVFSAPYSATAEVLTDAELCIGAGEDIRAIIADVPSFALDLARYLHLQLCRTRDRQAVLGTTGAQARLAAFLLHALPDSDRERIVAHHLTLRDLAGILGLSPETVCRALGTLKRRGIIEPLPGAVRILDLDALRMVERA
jgi:CRP/FNR family transcriptional regulator